jgi:hypothetical protein
MIHRQYLFTTRKVSRGSEAKTYSIFYFIEAKEKMGGMQWGSILP